MKKLYALSMSCLIAGMAFGQKQTHKAGPLDVTGKVKITNKYAHMNLPLESNRADKKGLTTFWSNDFNTPSEWSASNTSTPPGDWVVGTAGPTGSFSSSYGSITSTSGGNFAMFDSDALGNGTSTQDAILAYNGSVNCSGKSTVIFTCESYYVKFSDEVYVEVSDDNTNWTQFLAHNTAPNVPTANPELVTLDITSVAANKATVYFRFRFIGTWDYFWQVDDVKFSEISGDDIVMIAGGSFEADPYIITPVSQVQPNYTVYAGLYNAGSATVNSVDWSADVITYYGSENVTGMNAAPIAPLAVDLSFSSSMYPTATLIPDTSPVLTIFTTPYSDDDLTNNTDTSFWIAADSTLGINGVGEALVYYGALDSGIFVQEFAVFNTDTVTSTSAILYFKNTPSLVGKQVGMFILDANGNLVANSNKITVTSGDLDVANIAEHVFTYSPALVLNPGMYYVGFSDSLTLADEVVNVIASEFTPGPEFSLLGYLGDTAFVDFSGSFERTWTMYVHFGHTTAPVIVSNNEFVNSNVLNIFPNPATTELNVVLSNNNTGNIQIELVNTIGQVIYKNILNGTTVNNTIINVSEYNAGMYFLRATSSEGTSVYKVDIK